MIRFTNERHNIGNATARRDPEDIGVTDVSLIVVVSSDDVAAAQTAHARQSYAYHTIRFGHRYVDVLGVTEDGRVRIGYGRFHDTFEG